MLGFRVLGVPISRTIVFWGLCWGTPIQGNCSRGLAFGVEGLGFEGIGFTTQFQGLQG